MPLVQGDDGDQAVWVHGYLQRVEGDLSNVACWYGRARREVSFVPLDIEWDQIAADLLARHR